MLPFPLASSNCPIRPVHHSPGRCLVACVLIRHSSSDVGFGAIISHDIYLSYSWNPDIMQIKQCERDQDMFDKGGCRFPELISRYTSGNNVVQGRGGKMGGGAVALGAPPP